MVLQFGDVEVIELPVVAGENHPFWRLSKRKRKSREKHDRQEHLPVEDSSSISMDWKAQNRTIVDFETYEASRQERKLMEKDGKSLRIMRRLTRAVRKRM